MFVSLGLVAQKVTDLLPGSGVDLAKFAQVASPDQSPTRFLLIARMLWDKGVCEYVEAARQLKCRGSTADFWLLGFLDVQNPTAISRKQMDAWVEEGVVGYLGVSYDVRAVIAAANCVVLPSYREGTPRALLEAAAMGRPIITTDAVGCREVVDDGMNGFLCRPRDAADLAEKIERMTALSPGEREVMGRRGRQKMEREFDEQIVFGKYLDAIQDLLRNEPQSETFRPSALLPGRSGTPLLRHVA
jgi:glycosyltransferase involved in cell wall biosynthesis